MQCTVLTEGDIIRVDCSSSQSPPEPPPETAPEALAVVPRGNEAVGSSPSRMDLDSEAGTSSDRLEEAVQPSPLPLVFELLVGPRSIPRQILHI